VRSSLHPSREEEIVETAEAVADHYCRGQAICPEKIMNDERIGCSFGDYGVDSFEGMIELKDGRFFVYCNRERGNHPKSPRTRFTLAHELGHFFIPEHRKAIEQGVSPHPSKCGLFDGQQVPEELEADLFAANLLMPPSRFRPAAAKFRSLSPLRAILALKDQFKTSILATAVQYSPSNPDIVALMKWNHDGLAWKRIQDDFFLQRRYRSWKMSTLDALPKDCATHSALNQSSEGEQATVVESVLTAASCFNQVMVSGERNIVLREEAVRLGEHGVLSILSVHPKFPLPPANRC